MKICKLLVEGGVDCNAICLVRVETDNRWFPMRALTPLLFFSPNGLYPNVNLEALFVSRRAVLISTKLESYDGEDADREALQAATEALFILLHAPQREENVVSKKKKPRLWFRIWISF